MTVEVHSTIKKAKDTGNEFRSYFATAVDGEELAAPMSIIFTKKSPGKPRYPHALLSLEPVESTYGTDRNTGKPVIFISDRYDEKEIEPRKMGRPLCAPSKWTDGDKLPL